MPIILSDPPTTTDEYRSTRRYLAPILGGVPPDDRDDLLQDILASAVASYRGLLGSWRTHLYLIARRRRCDYFRARRAASPLPEDLPGPDKAAQIDARIDLVLLGGHLRPSQRRAIMAQKGGKTAHRARLRLRQIANLNSQEVSR